MSKVISYLTLRPFGNNLLCNNASMWLGCTLFIVSLMALTEAITWGTIAWLWLPSHFWPVSIIIGFSVFGLIWVVDAQLVLHDGSACKRSPHTSKLKNVLIKALCSAFFKLVPTKFGWGIVFRTFFITLSLVVTAPAMISLLLWSELDAQHQKQIGDIRQHLLLSQHNKYNSEYNKIDQEIDSYRTRLAKEIAGNGPSGISGVGPTAKAYERTLQRLEAERESLEEEFAKQKEIIINGSSQQLRDRFAVTISANSVGKRISTLASNPDLLREAPAHISGAFLISVYFALIILKVFQPQNVEIYLDAELQSAYLEYRRGGFSGCRPNFGNVVPIKSEMEPFVFRDWYVKYKSCTDDESIHISHGLFADGLSAEIARLTSIRDRFSTSIAEKKSLLSAKERDVLRLRHANNVNQLEIDKISASIDNTTADIDNWNNIQPSMLTSEQKRAMLRGVTDDRLKLANLREVEHKLLSEQHSTQSQLECFLKDIADYEVEIGEIDRRHNEVSANIENYEEMLNNANKRNIIRAERLFAMAISTHPPSG